MPDAYIRTILIHPPPLICMTQPGQSIATVFAPVSLMFLSFLCRICTDISGSLS